MAVERFDGRTILVTGATGLIGRSLVPGLMDLGATVRTASRSAAPGDWPDHRRGDLRDPAFVDDICAGIDGLFHLAGIRGAISWQRAEAATLLGENLLMDLLVLRATAAVPRRVYTSTVTVYPSLDGDAREDQAWDGDPHPSAEYVAWSKRMAEKFIEAQALQSGRGNTAVLRLVNSFGPHDDFDPETALVVPALIHRIETGENPLTVWGDGSAVRDFLFVEDAVEGLIRGYLQGIGEGPINIGSGSGLSIREVVETLVAVSGRDIQIAWDDTKPAGAARKVVATEKARHLLGFSARTPFAEAAAQTLAWYRANR
ncbi:MAG: NAD-dependent epimerase/dehydratase family protein [Alphaproteobacteria bacterium]|nr:NAD-dependent epimerase/dehydratase family protein [Alphaproteobacteria bacterium]